MKLFTLKLFLKTGLKGLFLFLPLLVAINAESQILVQNQTDPKLLYDRMLESRASYDFQGVFVYEQGGQIRTFDIESNSKEGQMSQSLEVLDGAAQQYRMSFNSGNCEQDAESISARLSPYYNFYVRGEERVAGLQGIEIVLAPIDKYRYGYQYVIEPNSGLMLRSVTLTPDRRMLERIQFTQLEFEPSAETDAEGVLDKVGDADNGTQADISSEVKTQSSVLADTDQNELTSDVTTLSKPITSNPEVGYNKISCNRLNIDSGWSAIWLPDGFSIMSSSFDGERTALVYSDGMATMSVFIDDVLDSFLPPSTAHRGATTIYINYLSDLSSTYLISIVGEVPVETAQRVLASLRRK